MLRQYQLLDPLSSRSKVLLGGGGRNCNDCQLYVNVKSPCIEPFGNGKRRIMVVGEAPGEVEDQRGKPWQGRAGSLLQKTMRSLGVELFEDCVSVNAVNCRPIAKDGSNRTPTSREISFCRPLVSNAIKTCRPKVIILMGSCAVESVIGMNWEKDIGGLERWVGWSIPDQVLGSFICPTYHPSFILRVGEPPEISRRWKRDLRNAIQLAQKDFPTLDDLNGCIEIAEDLSWIQDIPDGSTIAIDYETTGLKPWAEGHRIVAIGIALSENRSIAALVDQSDPEQVQLLRGLLTNDKIEKIAHNMKFEEMWSRVRLNCEVKGWKWDTMIAAHILDNRTGITSLKFQAYVQFGIPNYDELVAPFLSPSENSNRGANSKNRIELLLRSPEKTRELLKYCGMDALLTYRLAQVQISQISRSPSLSKAYRLFHRGALALENMEQNGIAIATEECEKLKNELSQTIDRLTDELIQSEFGQQWKAFIGPSKFNINSSDQLSKFLYEFKKIPPPKLTTSGKGSTDDEVLRELKIPELDKILEIRKLKKIRDTYLDQFLREQYGGVLHPFFQLHTTRTYRSSSDHPNFQNLPKRDPETMKICRSVIYPRPGRQFLSMDFSGIEVRIACIYTQDERLIKDTLSGDMHRDMAIELFLLDSLDKHDPNESRLRQAAKNSFVFPQFYGDYYVNCARNLIKWAADSRLKDGTPALEHLERKGLVRLDRRGNLISFDRFEQHVKKVEDAFWNERYRTYSAWKERMWRNYIKNGYVEMLTGFRCSGLMDRKQVSNYPIQGTAFHCLLWVLIEFDQLLKQNKKQSRLVSQVHDEVTVECPPEELQWCAKVLKRLAEKKLPQQWNWINVPLEVEFEICNVGEPLSMKRHWDLNKIS